MFAAAVRLSSKSLPSCYWFLLLCCAIAFALQIDEMPMNVAELI
jgi:hypothetical protein